MSRYFPVLVLLTIVLIVIQAGSMFYSQKGPGENQEKKKEKQGFPQLSRASFKAVFALPQGISASAPQYQLPLAAEEIENLGEFSLKGEALEKLLSNGFVVVPSRVDDLADYYQALEREGEPIVITSDAVFFLYHTFFESMLMRLEKHHFYGTLQQLLSGLVEEAYKVYEKAEDGTILKEAAYRDLAYLSVALSLLDGNFTPPQPVRELVNKELQLMLAADKPMTISPIFGYREDYTQYKPRGHYTQSETFKKYFRCMMWLGRMRFEARDPENLELARVQTAQALLLTYLMFNTEIGGEKAIKLWEKIYAPTAFIVGESDDLTFYDYAEAAREVYGSFSPQDLEDQEKLDVFMKHVAGKSRSKIIGSPVFPSEINTTVGLRFMGQRFILDGYIHQELCYPRLPNRLKVKGLDVMVALGSERALTHLEEDLKTYPGYGEKLNELKEKIDSISEEEWGKTLYNGWLYTIKLLLKPRGEGYPSFMQTTAWQDKTLNTAMSTWSQLRHDTILYAKQPYAGLTAIPPKPKKPLVYVEPYPDVYAALKTLVDATRQGLANLSLLDARFSDKLASFSNLLDAMVNASLKELRGEELSEREVKYLRSFGYMVESLTTINEPRTKDPRIIADVFTEPNSGEVLEVGTGYFDIIYLVFTAPDGKKYIGAGLTMSYYEFYWPQQNRLTDEQWREMLEKGSAPFQPSWTSSFKA